MRSKEVSLVLCNLLILRYTLLIKSVILQLDSLTCRTAHAETLWPLNVLCINSLRKPAQNALVYMSHLMRVSRGTSSSFSSSFIFLIFNANRLQSAVTMIISMSGGALGLDLVVKGWRGSLIPVASSPHIPSLKTPSTCCLNRRKNMTGL